MIRHFLAATLLAACTPSASPPRASVPRILDITASDGIVLKATMFASATPGPAVLLLHQCDEQRKVWDSLGVRLAKAGMTALSLDYRGYGESGGTPHDKVPPAELAMQMNEQWPNDIDSAFTFLERQSGVDRTTMGVGGGSCGVHNAIHLAMSRPNVKALSLLAGGTDKAGRAYLEAPGSPPIFTGAAADDKYANFVDIMGWLFALSPNAQSRMMQYPDGGHAAMVFNAHPDFPDSIAKWFSAVLQNKPALIPATNGRGMSAEVVTVLRDIDQPGGAAAVGKRLAELRKKDQNARLFPEYFVNALGYEHLQAKDLAGGVAIMELNVAAYPESPNAMDSLGDAYLIAGDRKRALDAAKKTLVLLDRDTTDSASRIKDIRAAAQHKIEGLMAK